MIRENTIEAKQADKNTGMQSMKKNNNKKPTIGRYFSYHWLLLMSVLLLSGCYELDNPVSQQTEADNINITGKLLSRPRSRLFALSDQFDNQTFPVQVNRDLTFSVNVPLAPGENRITHNMIRFPFLNAGEYITVVRTSTNIPPVDNTAPELLVSTANNQSTLYSYVVIAGTVSDSGSGIRSVYAQSDVVPGRAIPARINSLNQFRIRYPLSLGQTNITITAVDRAGNQSNVLLSINREKALLLDLPVYSETEDPSVAVSGTLQTIGPFAVTSIELSSDKISGSNFTATIEGNRFNVDIPLHFGNNILTLTAKNLSAVVDQKIIEIKRVDLTPPTLTVNNPTTQILKAGQIVVTGSAQDNLNGQGLQSVTILSTRLNNPVQASFNGNTFTATVALEAGSNQLSISATDLAGNTAGPVVISVIRPDQDGDGIPDDIDPDRDGDGFNNDIETAANTNPDDPADFPDTVAPSLQINNPLQQTVESNTIILTGSISDPQQPHSGIAAFIIHNERFTGTQYSAFVENGQFSVELPLQYADNKLTLTLTDLSGNQTISVRTVKRILQPAFVNVTPANGSVLTTDSVTISGEIHAYLEKWQADNETLTDIRFYINDSQITPTGSSETGRFSFNLPGQTLNIGSNTFNLRIVSPDGSKTQTLQLSYRPQNAADIPAPVIELLSPVDGSLLNSESFLLAARVTSSGGPLTISLNNSPVKIPAYTPADVFLSEPVSFTAGQDSMTVTLLATDSLGKQSRKDLNYHIDRGLPQIIINNALVSLPDINPISETPYPVSGRVIDSNLASFLVNGQSVELSPAGSPGAYDFDFAIAVPAGTEVSVQLQANDLSGNQTQLNYTLQSTTQSFIEAILPADKTRYIAQGVPIDVQLAARVGGLNNATVAVRLLQNNIALSQSDLSLNSGFATGQIQIPDTAGDYTLSYEVYDNGVLITSTRRMVIVSNASTEPLSLLRMEPITNSSNKEPNEVLEFYFNQAIDLTKLNISVKETLHGKTWLNKDAPGLDFINARGSQLIDVNRNFELVPGKLSLLPGSQIAAFYPERHFGFNADIQIQVIYDGNEIAAGRFKIRPLPTFVIGSVMDQFGQILSGITITLPELNLRTVTNGDGGFSFGFQKNESNIPGGRYRLELNTPDENDSGYNPLFGTQIQTINLQTGRKNDLPPTRLQALNKDIAWQQIQSGQQAILAGGDLQLDLSNALILFSNSRTDGEIHTQFASYNQILAQKTPGLEPLWLYANQPRGIAVEGKIDVRIVMPMFDGSYDYIPPGTDYVVLLGYQPDREVIEAVGIGQVNQHIVTSTEALSYTSLDYIGYTMVLPQQQTLLKDVAEGRKTLQQLMAELQSINQGDQ